MGSADVALVVVVAIVAAAIVIVKVVGIRAQIRVAEMRAGMYRTGDGHYCHGPELRVNERGE